MPSESSESDCGGWNTSAFQSDSTGNAQEFVGFNSCISVGSDRNENEIGGRPEVPLTADLKWNFLWLSILIVATAAGNLMVCVAVYYERTLQNMSNYFLTSLAVVDFLVSIFIMPIGLVILVFGRLFYRYISQSIHLEILIKSFYVVSLKSHSIHNKETKIIDTFRKIQCCRNPMNSVDFSV